MEEVTYSGMTLRQHYAGLAMASALRGTWPSRGGECGIVAAHAFDMADSMISHESIYPPDEHRQRIHDLETLISEALTVLRKAEERVPVLGVAEMILERGVQ